MADYPGWEYDALIDELEVHMMPSKEADDVFFAVREALIELRDIKVAEERKQTDRD